MTDQPVVVLQRSMTGVTMFLLGCVLDAVLGLAFTDSLAASGGSILGEGYIGVSQWYFYGVMLVGVLIQLSIVFFGAREYAPDVSTVGDVIAGAIFFVVPILYFVMFIFTEYLYTRQVVNLEFANGVTLFLNFLFVWASAMTLLLQASNARV